jgi:integrase
VAVLHAGATGLELFGVISRRARAPYVLYINPVLVTKGGLMKRNITEQAAVTLRENQIIWDVLDMGFGVRRQRDVPVFMVRYRQNKMRRHVTLGTLKELSVQEARQKARIILDAAKCRHDPIPQTWKIRRSKSGAVDFGEFAERYLSEFAAPRKKPASLLADRRNLELHILPHLGDRRLIDIDRQSIMKMHASQRATPVAANRSLALVSHIFTVAEKWGLLAMRGNPCKGADRFRERPRERYLSDDELHRLGEALKTAEMGYQAVDWSTYSSRSCLVRTTAEDWRAVAAMRLLIFTGARMTEILSLRWDWIDKGRGVGRLPDSKTGPKLLFLPQRAMFILEELSNRIHVEYPGSPFVLPGDRPWSHFQGLFHPWRRVRTIARLNDLRIHDLRHVFASTAVSAGDSLYMVGRILGHRQPSTTQRYAHLSIGPVLEVANRTASRLAKCIY